MVHKNLGAAGKIEDCTGGRAKVEPRGRRYREKSLGMADGSREAYHLRGNRKKREGNAWEKRTQSSLTLTNRKG